MRSGRVMLAVLLAVVLATTALADDGEQLRRGNAQVAAEQFEAALESYGARSEIESPRLTLARAMAQARLGHKDEAGEALDALLGQSPPDAVAHLAHATRGAMLLEQGAAVFTQDPGKAIPVLEQAAEHYLKAFAIEKSDVDAARNVEYIRSMIEQARQQQAEQQKQQEQQQQQNQETADKLDQLAQQQEQEAQENQQQEQSQDQQQQQQDQGQISKQTEEHAEDLENQENQSSSQQQAQEALERARESQKKAQEALQRGDTSEAAQHQQDAADALRQAAEQLRKGQEQDEKQESDSEQEEQQQAQQDQEQEGDSIAEQIIDREQEFRKQRQAVLEGRPIRVERDW